MVERTAEDPQLLNKDLNKDLSNTSSSLRACIDEVMILWFHDKSWIMGPALTNPDDPGDDGMSKMEMQ